MKEERYYIALDKYDKNIVINALNTLRTVTRLQTLFWYRHRCPKRHSLKTTTLGSRAVSM